MACLARSASKHSSKMVNTSCPLFIPSIATSVSNFQVLCRYVIDLLACDRIILSLGPSLCAHRFGTRPEPIP